MKDPNHKVLQYLWISDCWETKWKEVENYTQAVISKTWHNKYLNLNMNWVSYSNLWILETDDIKYCNCTHLSLSILITALSLFHHRATLWTFQSPSKTPSLYTTKIVQIWWLGWTKLLKFCWTQGAQRNLVSGPMSLWSANPCFNFEPVLIILFCRGLDVSCCVTEWMHELTYLVLEANWNWIYLETLLLVLVLVLAY